MTLTLLPSIGDPYTIVRTPGYKLVQDRPFDCRNGRCQCGKCDGVRVECEGTVDRVVHYADNSIEVEVRMPDGRVMTDMVKAPSGDVCF